MANKTIKAKAVEKGLPRPAIGAWQRYADLKKAQY